MIPEKSELNHSSRYRYLYPGRDTDKQSDIILVCILDIIREKSRNLSIHFSFNVKTVLKIYEKYDSTRQLSLRSCFYGFLKFKFLNK